jgi:dolichol-phosphate mannosyltransferase
VRGHSLPSAFRWLLDGPYRRLLRFGLVGLSGVLVNLAVMAALVELGGLNEAVAAGCAAETAILTNFALNDRWTFADAPTGLSTIGRAARYNLVALGGLLVSVAIVAGLTRGLGLHYLPANLLAIGAAFGWNYVLTSQFAWAVQPTMSESEPGRAR